MTVRALFSMGVNVLGGIYIIYMAFLYDTKHTPIIKFSFY